MKLFESADIVIYIKDKGIVLKEKSLVAYNAITGKIIAYGNDVLIEENNKDNIKIISPMRRGMVVDHTISVKMFKCFFNKVYGKRILHNLHVAVCVPNEITPVDEVALKDSLYQAGAKEVFLTNATLEQLLKETHLLNLPDNWKKFKIFISITKDEPERYIVEQLSEIVSYAKNEKLPLEKIKDMFQEMLDHLV